MLALRAGENGYQRWLVHCTPHFLFFFQKKKRKRAVHGPKEKRALLALAEASRFD